MNSIPFGETPCDASPVVDHGQGGSTVNVRPEHPDAYTMRVPVAPAEDSTETTTPLPRVDASAPPVGLAGVEPVRRGRRSLPVLLGTRPDPELVARNLVPVRERWLTWSYEPRDMREARTARYRQMVRLRQRSAELARRVQAMKKALAPMLRVEPYQVDIHVPVDFDADGAEPVRLALPDDFSRSTGAAILELLGDRLGGDWTARWHLDRYPAYAEFRRRVVQPKPPASVDWELSRDRYSIFVGKTGTRDVYVKTETETPHWGVSAGTGGGKTSTLLLPAIHWRGHGGLVDVIDLKAESYVDSLEGVSGFRVHKDVISAAQAMAEFLVSSKAVTLARENGYPDPIPPRVLLIDEFGSFVSAVENWWKYGLKEKGSAPVFAWFHMILMQGRTKDHRVVVGTHDFAANTFKSTAVRDLIGTKILIGPVSGPKWVTAFGYEVKKINYDSKKPGRGVIGVAGAGVEELQLAYISPEDARAVCSDFTPAPEWFDNCEMAPWITDEAVELTDREAAVRGFLPGGEYIPADATMSASQALSESSVLPGSGDTQRSGLRLVHSEDAEQAARDVEMVGLREALEEGHLMQLIREANYRNPTDPPEKLIEKALFILRKARREDEAFPPARSRRGSEKLYLVRELQEWEQNRPNRMDLDTEREEKASGE